MTYSSLPEDILFDIFCLVSHEEWFKGPLKVSQCCRKWRAIALNAPALWTTVEIYGLRPLRWLKAWVDRSRNRCLTVWFNASRLDTWQHVAYITDCLQILKTQIYRVGTLSIVVDSSTPEIMNHLLSHRRLPALTKLSISFERSHANDWPNHFPNNIAIGVAPNLQFLEISGFPIDLLGVVDSKWCNNHVFAPGLRRLVLSGCQQDSRTNEHAFLTLLERCHSIEELLLPGHCIAPWAVGPVVQPPYLGSVVTAPKLKTLDFGTNLDYSGAHFIGNLRAPNLTYMHSSIPYRLIPHLASIRPFPFPSLQILKIQEHQPRSSDSTVSSWQLDDLVTVLSHLPDLHSVSIGHVQFVELHCDPLPLLKSLASICPKLSSVLLYRWRGPATVAEGLQELIKARKASKTLSQILRLHIVHSEIDSLIEKHGWFTDNVDYFVGSCALCSLCIRQE